MQIIPFLRKNVDCQSRDWTTDELAQLYRVESALVQLNIALETDRGLTDEGDPWFVFSRDGSVIVHISRFDGRYHLHAIAFSLQLSGFSFADVTRSFVEQFPLSLPTDRNEKIVLHPMAVFIALVAAAFFASNENAEAAVTKASDAVLHRHASILPGEELPDHRFAEKQGAQNLSHYLNAVAIALAAIAANSIVQERLPSLTFVQSDDSQVLATNVVTSHASSVGLSFDNLDRARSLSPDTDLTEALLVHSSASLNAAESIHAVISDEMLSAESVEGHFTVEIPEVSALMATEAHSQQFAISAYRVALRSSTSSSSPSDTGPQGEVAQPALSNESVTTSASLEDSVSRVDANAANHDLASNQHSEIVWNEVATLISDRSVLIFDEPVIASSETPSVNSSPTAQTSKSVVQIEAANDDIESIPDENPFTPEAAEMVKEFVLSNPTAKVFTSPTAIIIYDGLSKAEDPSPFVIKTWELAGGGTISIVGHLDHPIHYDTFI
jgi:hypothetical protein